MAPTRDEAERALAGLSRQIDDRKEIAWFEDRSTIALVVGEWVKLYFGRREDRTLGMRLQVQREWEGAARGSSLRFELDGEVRRLPTERTDWMQSEGGGKRWVMIDLPLSVRDPELLRRLVSASQVRVSVESTAGTHPFAVPRQQIEAAARVHAAWLAVRDWERLGGGEL